MIIAAYAGTGKTYFASLYPQKVIDLVCMPYKYIINSNNIFDESSKANIDDVLNPNWPLNYLLAIKNNLQSDKIILIPPDYFILMLLKSENMQYYICYPQRNIKEQYLKRYIDRGNNANFIDIFIGRWDEFIDSYEKDSFGKHIVLQANQFLSDVIEVLA